MILIMPVAFALCLLLTPQAPASPVTVKYTGRVDGLLAQISQQTGTELTAGRKEGAEILIVAIKDATLDETMKQIAWATYGTWEKEKDGFKLIRDTAAERRADREYVARTIDYVGASIARFRTLVEALPPAERFLRMDSSMQFGITGARSMPARDARFLLGVATALSLPDVVNRKSMEDTAVFSNMATPAQHRLGPGAEQALRAFVASRPDTEEFAPPVRILAKATATPYGGWLNVQLYDAQGNLYRGAPYLLLPFSTEKPTPSVPKELIDAIPADATVPLSPQSKFFGSRSEEEGDGLAPSEREYAAMPEAIERLRNPEKFEPLGTFATDAWRAVGAHTGRNLVVNMDDRLFVPMWRGEPPSLRGFLNWPSMEQVEMPSQWLRIRPTLLNSPWGHRLDRAVMGRYVRAPYRYRSLGQLEAGAEFVTRCGMPFIPPNIGFYLVWASQGNLTSDGSGGWLLERFYGQLPEAARRAWISGQGVDVSALPPEAKRALSRWAVSVNVEMSGLRMKLEPSAIFSEPTIRFPLGMVTRGVLRAELKQETGFATRIPRETGGFNERWDSVESLAWLLNAMTKGAEKVQIHPSMQQSLRISADLGEEGRPERTLTYFTSEPSKYVPWGRMPADVVREIRTQIARRRASDN